MPRRVAKLSNQGTQRPPMPWMRNPHSPPNHSAIGSRQSRCPQRMRSRRLRNLALVAGSVASQSATGFRLLRALGLGKIRFASERGSPIARSSRCFVFSCGARRPLEISIMPDHARPLRRCSSRRESPFRSAADRTRLGYRGISRLLWHTVQSISPGNGTNQRKHTGHSSA